jgi:phage minor structural protein
LRYLECFDKNFQRNGFLQYADQVQRKRRLNSDYELSFLVPMNSDDYNEKIALKGHVKDEKGQYYVINGRKRNRDGLKRMAQIDCTHIMFKLVDFKMPYSSYIEESFGVNIAVLTNLISAATGGKFTFIIDSTFDIKDIKDFGHGNAMEALVYVIKTYGCEVEPNNFVIHLKAQIGVDDGVQFRFKKNIINSSFEDSVRGLVTRMYGEMKDGLTFIGLPASNLTTDEFTLLNAVPGAIVGGIIQVNYLISPFAAAWSNTTNTFFDGEFIDQNIEDQLDLLIATRKELAVCEVPSIDVTINAADLFKIDSSEPKPNLGDIAYSIDPLMELNNISARVVELTEYPFQMDRHTDVRLANFMLKDQLDYQAQFDATKRIVDDLISGGKVRTNAFEDFAKQAVFDINSSKTEIIYDTRGIILQEQTNPLEQVIMASRGIYLTVDGGLTSEVAITAAGIVAEMIRGTIGNFVMMSAESIVTGDLTGINIVGTNITGTSTVTGALIRTGTSYPRIEFNSVGNLLTVFLDASHRLDIIPNLGGVPAIEFTAPGQNANIALGAAFSLLSNSEIDIQNTSGDIFLDTPGNVEITAPGGLWVNGTFIA